MRSRIVLVVGYIGESSGKTLLATSIVSVGRSLGIRIAPFKPYAATSLWENPWILREIRERRLVVSNDSLKMINVASGLHPELLNPVALIVGVPDASRNNWRPTPVVLGGPLELGILGRISMCRDRRVDTLHFINIEALNRMPQTIQDAVIEAAASLKPYPLRVGQEFTARVVSGEHDRAVWTCLDRLDEMFDVLVVESNHDVPLPLKGLRPDLVVVAAPGYAGIVDGRRYMRSVEALGLTGGPLRAVTVEEVIRLSGVQETVPLPFLERKDSLYGFEDLAPIMEKIILLSSKD